MKRLEENSSIETFRTENEAFERHKLNVVNEENKIKVGKILRDTEDFTHIKSKYDAKPKKQKCRRFKRKVNIARNVLNVENVLEPEETLENRFGGKVKNISSRILTDSERTFGIRIQILSCGT